MNLQIPKDCDPRRVKVSPFEAKLKWIPRGLLDSRFNTYGKLAREDVYAAFVLMGADGKITREEVGHLDSYFALIHPTNLKPGVPELVAETLQALRKEMRSEDYIVVEPFSAEYFKGAALDFRLLGFWRHSESYSSGDFYAQNYTYIEFVGDGTFRTGSRVDVSATSRLSSGAWGGNTSGSSAGGLNYAGKWETEDDILVLRPTWGVDERLNYQVNDQGLLTQKHLGENKLYVRVSG